MELTHFNKAGNAKMVDVTPKEDSNREAVAVGRVTMKPETLKIIKAGEMGKGDVLAVAQVAGIMGAKKTWEFIPMCHPLLLSGINIEFKINEAINSVEIMAKVKTTGKTGVEMEALTAVTIAALTVYDMCKAVDKDMMIEEVCLVKKLGGKSGEYTRS